MEATMKATRGQDEGNMRAGRGQNEETNRWHTADPGGCNDLLSTQDKHGKWTCYVQSPSLLPFVCVRVHKALPPNRTT